MTSFRQCGCLQIRECVNEENVLSSTHFGMIVARGCHSVMRIAGMAGLQIQPASPLRVVKSPTRAALGCDPFAKCAMRKHI
jgi:hypothetical protein